MNTRATAIVVILAGAIGLVVAGIGFGDGSENADPGRGASASLEWKPILELPDVVTLSYACDRVARTFATRIAVPGGGATLEAERLEPPAGDETVEPGERFATELAPPGREHWKLSIVTGPETRRVDVVLEYESRPESHDCVLKLLRLEARTESHAS